MGHRVRRDKIKPRLALVKSIKEFRRPETKSTSQIRSFLGLVGTRGKGPTRIEWPQTHEQVFEDLKEALQKTPVLRPPHWDEHFILQVDASNRGLGAILSQTSKDGEEHPVAFASRKLQLREEKLSAIERMLRDCLGCRAV